MIQAMLSEQEAQALRKFRQLPLEQQETFFYLIDALAALAGPQQPPSSKHRQSQPNGPNL
jgi:hypothetical protein